MNKAKRDLQSERFGEQSWLEIYRTLKDREKKLNSEELYQLALAAYLIGHDVEGVDVFAKAHHCFLEDEKTGQAIRCAFWIGLLLIFNGERARGSGWLSRAKRLVEDHHYEGAENGFLLLPPALGALNTGKTDIAYENFKKAYEAGKDHHDMDLTALGLLGQGQALIQLGKVSEGMTLLDEVMVSVEYVGISPLVIGIVYCGVIETCQKIFDIPRAQEWTVLLSQWCESQPDLVPYRGECMIRRSQIRHIHGEWPEALDELKRASQMLSQPPGEPAAGEAYYQLAEMFRLKGDFQQAEKLYVEANKYGRKPQPGIAILRLAQNEKDLAVKSIQNALDEVRNPVRRVKILPAYTKIMLANDRISEARTASGELDALAKKYDTVFLRAVSAYCQGAIRLKEGDVDSAIQYFRNSLNLWNELDTPYETAAVRLLLGRAYREKGDQDSASMELSTAQWIFKELEAVPDLRAVEALMGEQQVADRHGLTLREVQVLQLVSEGDTNKLIAGKLFISERTVERHLTNIFNKLQVNSRTEATTFAYKHGIL